MNVEKLVRMVNQIAANFDYGSNRDKAADSVADHLRRFWSPPMRAQIIEHARRGGTGLSEVAALAVDRLEGEKKNTA